METELDFKIPIKRYLSDESRWLETLNYYFNETEATKYAFCENVRVPDILKALKHLSKTQIVELDIPPEPLLFYWDNIRELLKKSNVKKIIFRRNLSQYEIANLGEILEDKKLTHIHFCGADDHPHNSDDKKFQPPNPSRRGVHDFESFRDRRKKASRHRMDLFISCLLQTNLESFHFKSTSSLRPMKPLSCGCSWIRLISLKSLTDLTLNQVSVSSEEFGFLYLGLKNSNIKTLGLSAVRLTDKQLNALGHALRGSKVLNLDLSYNEIRGSNHFFVYLKDTIIESLKLNDNYICQRKIFNFPTFLRYSRIASLNINNNPLSDEICSRIIRNSAASGLKVLSMNVTCGMQTYNALIKNLQDTAIVDLEISAANFTAEALIAFGKSLIGRNLERLALIYWNISSSDSRSIINFLEIIKASLIKNLSLSSMRANRDSFTAILRSATFKTVKIELCERHMCDLFTATPIAPVIHFTSIVNLTLKSIGLGDLGAMALAKSISNSPILYLDLSSNSIRDDGAAALALSIKDSKLRHLKLYDNAIGDIGLMKLIKQVEISFMIELDIRKNHTTRHLLVEATVLRNRIAIFKMLKFFRILAPEAPNMTWNFHRACEIDRNIEEFFSKCLYFFKNIFEKAAILDHIFEDRRTCLTKAQFESLFASFPEQFALFLDQFIEADAFNYVNLLKEAERLKLSPVVEQLLFHRSLFVIEHEDKILHPYAYVLMHKNRMPIYSSLEPSKRDKILQYLKANPYLEGANDVLKLLSNPEV